jgi:hypothetical protein
MLSKSTFQESTFQRAAFQQTTNGGLRTVVAHQARAAFGEIRVEVSSEKGDGDLKLLVDAHGKRIHASTS